MAGLGSQLTSSDLYSQISQEPLSDPGKRILLFFKNVNIMYRYLFRFIVMTLTILTANLVSNAISNYLVSYRNHFQPLLFTLTGMAITVAVFYPLFIKLESWIKNLSIRVIRTGNSVSGKYIGLFISFLFGIIVLFYFYARMWYHIDFVRILLNGNIGMYI
jgi:hypothetical protein